VGQLSINLKKNQEPAGRLSIAGLITGCFINNQTSLPMQLNKQSFEKLLHPPSSPPPLRPLPKGPLSSPFLKVFHLFRKGGNRFGDEKSLGRMKEIKYSIFLLLSLNFHYNPIPPHFIPPHSTFEMEKLRLDLYPYTLSFLAMY
jgi:hypothetical protein